jgi:hypothetical protein
VNGSGGGSTIVVEVERIGVKFERRDGSEVRLSWD